jgi:hypothetical protein
VRPLPSEITSLAQYLIALPTGRNCLHPATRKRSTVVSEPTTTDNQQERSMSVSSSDIWRALYNDLSGRIKDEYALQYDTVKWIVTSEFAFLGFYYIYRVPHTHGTIYLWVIGLLLLDTIGIVLLIIAQRGKRFARIQYIRLLDVTTQEFRRTYFFVVRGFPLSMNESEFMGDNIYRWKQRYTTLWWWDRHELTCYVSVIILPILLFILLASYSLG